MNGIYPSPPPTYNMPFGMVGNMATQYALNSMRDPLTPGFNPLPLMGTNPVDAIQTQHFYDNYQAQMYRAGAMSSGRLESMVMGGLYSAGINPSVNARAGIHNIASQAMGMAYQFSTSMPAIRPALDILGAQGGQGASSQAAFMHQAQTMRDPITGQFGMSPVTQQLMMPAIGHGLSMPNDPGELGGVYVDPFKSLKPSELAMGMAGMRQMGIMPNVNQIEDALRSPMAQERARAKAKEDRTVFEQSLVDLGEQGINSLDDYYNYQDEQRTLRAEVFANRASESQQLREESQSALLKMSKRAEDTFYGEDVTPAQAQQRMQEAEAQMSTTEYAERVLSLGATLGGDMAFQKGAMADDFRQALEALRGNDLDKFKETDVGKALSQDATIGDATDLLTASMAAHLPGVSAEELHQMALTQTTDEINAAGRVNQQDLFGMDAYNDAMDKLSKGNETAATISAGNADELSRKMIPQVRSMNAIFDLLASPEYRDFAQRLPNQMAAIDALSGTAVTHQLTPEKSRQYARQLEYASATLGVGPEQVMSISQTVGQISNQYGMQAAMVPELTMSGIYYNQTFNEFGGRRAGIYGAASSAQLATQAINLEARGAKSADGRRLGSLSALMDHAQKSSTPEGKALASAIEKARQGDTSEIQKYLEMDRSELVENLASSTGLSESLISKTLDNELMSEEQMHKYAGLRQSNKIRQQQEVIDEVLSVQGGDGVRSAMSDSGMSGAAKEMVSSLLTDAYNQEGMSSGQFNADRFAAAGLKRLKSVAETDTPEGRAAQEYLSELRSRYGTDEEIISGMQQNEVFGYRVGVERAQNAPVDDLFTQFGDPAIDTQRRNRAAAQASGFLAEIMSGETAMGVEGLVDLLTSAGEDGEPVTAMGILGAIQGVDFTGKSREIQLNTVAKLETLQKEAKARREEIYGGDYSKEERRTMLAELDRELSGQTAGIMSAMFEDADNAGVREDMRKKMQEYNAKTAAERAAAMSEGGSGGGGPGGAGVGPVAGAAAGTLGDIAITGAQISINGQVVLEDGEGKITQPDGTVDDAGVA